MENWGIWYKPGFQFANGLCFTLDLMLNITRLAVWVSGSALTTINVVALHQTRLVPGWVTVSGRVNHLSM